MLVEKWTAGRITVSKDRLRRLSGDTKKGSNFNDLAPVLRRLGLKARWSPEGGEFVTWNEMRARIRAGGGAVLLGDYHELPRYYGRWAPRFWKKKGKKDNHAIYLDRYDGRTDQFWVMDPLAPAGWKGEWIPARYLRSFAWQTGGGGLWVMLTPTAKRAPFSGVKLAPPEAAVRDGQLQVDWKVRKAPKRWRLPRVKVKTRVERIKNPASLAIMEWVSTPVGEPAAKKQKPSARYAQKTIRARMRTPARPGAYEIAMSLGERRFGRTVARSSTVVFVPGKRRGSIVAKDPGAVIAGETFDLEATVMNTGSVDWADPEWLSASAAKALDRRRNTRVRALWHLVEPDDRDAERAAADPEDVLAVPLKPGAGRTGTADRHRAEHSRSVGAHPRSGRRGRWLVRGRGIGAADDADPGRRRPVTDESARLTPRPRGRLSPQVTAKGCIRPPIRGRPSRVPRSPRRDGVPRQASAKGTWKGTSPWQPDFADSASSSQSWGSSSRWAPRIRSSRSRKAIAR